VARKRKAKRSLDPAKVLWPLLIVNLLVGAWVSPITALGRVRVRGVSEDDRSWVRKVLQDMRDVPYSRSRPQQVERRLLGVAHLRSASLRTNIFGSGLLVVRYHVPVARLADSPQTFLSDEGVLFNGSSHPVVELPTLLLPADALRPSAAVVGAWRAREVAWLCGHLPKALPPNEAVVEVESNGVLCLKTPAPGRIRLGDAQDLDQKLGVVERFLLEQPDLLSKVEELNVTSPQHPVRIPLGGASR